MKEIEFTLNGEHRRLTRSQVQEAVSGVEPGVIYELAVWVGGAWYPAKQPFCAALGLSHRKVNSRAAMRHLDRLEFPTHDESTQGPRPISANAVPAVADVPTRAQALSLAVDTLRTNAGTNPRDVIALADDYLAWLTDGQR